MVSHRLYGSLSGPLASMLVFCTGEEGPHGQVLTALGTVTPVCCGPWVEEAAVSMMPFEIEASGVPFSESSCQKGGRYLPQRKKSWILCLWRWRELGDRAATVSGGSASGLRRRSQGHVLGSIVAERCHLATWGTLEKELFCLKMYFTVLIK